MNHFACFVKMDIIHQFLQVNVYNVVKSARHAFNNKNNLEIIGNGISKLFINL